MTTLSNPQASGALRLRTEAVGERNNTRAAKTAGELAGRFASMLEQLNGVNGAEAGTGATSSTSERSASERPVALGAVSLLALQPDDPTLAAPATAAAATESLHDVRWLAKLYNDMEQAAD